MNSVLVCPTNHRGSVFQGQAKGTHWPRGSIKVQAWRCALTIVSLIYLNFFMSCTADKSFIRSSSFRDDCSVAKALMPVN